MDKLKRYEHNRLFPRQQPVKPRIRIIIDNDFGGDPDGLFQLVHHLLSPSVEIRGIIGSFFMPGGFFNADETSINSCKTIKEILEIMNFTEKLPVYRGAETALTNIKTPVISDGSKMILQEAMREDTDLPLYVVCGAGLTNIASAYLAKPEIAEHLTLIWIGGHEYPGMALPPPGFSNPEYNISIDIKAAQVIFNASQIPLWQVPRNTYRQALISYSELITKIKPEGKIGEYLTNKIENVMHQSQKSGQSLGEAYIMGDSPLVLLTALQSSFNMDPSSSNYILKQAPKITDSGLYEENPSSRIIRVYTDIDIRLMFEDFFAKLTLFNLK